MATVNDNFDGADSSDLGTNWDVVAGSGFEQVSNEARCNTGSPVFDGAEVNNEASWTSDHSSQVHIDSATGAGGAGGIACRASVGTGYYCGAYSDSSSSYGFIVDGGGFDTQGTSAAWSNDDVIRGEASGNALTIYENDVENTDLAVDITGLSGGGPGLAGYGAGAGQNTVDDWVGADLGGEDGTSVFVWPIRTVIGARRRRRTA